MLQENIKDRDIHNTSSNFDAYIKPRLANMWTSNLGFQKFNETGYIILDNIRTRKCVNKSSKKIRVPKRKSKTFIINKDIFKVR